MTSNFRSRGFYTKNNYHYSARDTITVSTEHELNRVSRKFLESLVDQIEILDDSLNLLKKGLNNDLKEINFLIDGDIKLRLEKHLTYETDLLPHYNKENEVKQKLDDLVQRTCRVDSLKDCSKYLHSILGNAGIPPYAFRDYSNCFDYQWRKFIRSCLPAQQDAIGRINLLNIVSEKVNDAFYYMPDSKIYDLRKDRKSVV